MVLIWIHQPADQDYWSRPDHPKIVKTPPAISRYDGGHASLLIGAGLSNLHQLTPFVKMLFRKNFDDADNATRNIKQLVSLVGSVHMFGPIHKVLYKCAHTRMGKTLICSHLVEKFRLEMTNYFSIPW